MVFNNLQRRLFGGVRGGGTNSFRPRSSPSLLAVVLLAGLQFAEGDGSDPFEILLVVRQKLRNPMVDHSGSNVQIMNLMAQDGVLFDQLHEGLNRRFFF
jgi:hypothetical protein